MNLASSPKFLGHRIPQREVTKFLEDNGFFVVTRAYHDVMPDDQARRLSKLYWPTALEIRGSTDAIAVHRELDIDAFKWEVKSGSHKYGNMSIEALPFAKHQRLSRQFGVKCLYIYSNVGKKHFGCFWVKDDIKVSRVLVPPQRNGKMDTWYHDTLSFLFPDVLVEVSGKSDGSGDPFVIIDEEYLPELLLPWQDEILRYVSSGGLLPGE